MTFPQCICLLTSLVPSAGDRHFLLVPLRLQATKRACTSTNTRGMMLSVTASFYRASWTSLLKLIKPHRSCDGKASRVRDKADVEKKRHLQLFTTTSLFSTQTRASSGCGERMRVSSHSLQNKRNQHHTVGFHCGAQLETTCASQRRRAEKNN